MELKKILIVGKNGQLAKELFDIHLDFTQFYEFQFYGRDLIDMENVESLQKILDYKPNYIINATAYTAVDLAETEIDKSHLVNCTSVAQLSTIANQMNAILIHFSTDYVFNGTDNVPYKEDHPTDPINMYGLSKRDGEILALKNNPNRTIIIRTSWLYSIYGKNFLLTMIHLMKNKSEINVVNDQIGCPTYCADLANCIMEIIRQIDNDNTHFGIFHFQNKGQISWYDFAVAIKNKINSTITINPVTSNEFKTASKRPNYSVLATSKIQEKYFIEIKNWKNSLDECIKLLIVNC